MIGYKIKLRRLNLLLHFEMSEKESLKILKANDEVDKLIRAQNFRIRALQAQIDRVTKKMVSVRT